MFSFFKQSQKHASPIFLFNTLTGEKERFSPMRKGEVRMYSCGPTVYGPQHIGNLRAAIFSDLLARTFKSAGYSVRRVTNITDVGHLVGDGDEGEDKMTVGAKRDLLRPEDVAAKYTAQYLEDIKELNIDISDIEFPKATEYIQEQIQLIQRLEKKGHTYRAEDGIYFDTSTFPDYGKLGGIATVKIKPGARVRMVEGKKNIHDFALWRFSKKGDLQFWSSPWGPGNPGWSIECSAMAGALLGETIDVHTGGEDHIGVHHNNEIAQSEGANDRPLARIWMHNAFLTIEGEKISKSLGNIYTLGDIKEKSFHPLAFRYLLLQAHYKSPLSFSFEALASSEEALTRLWKVVHDLKKKTKGKGSDSDQKAKMEALLRDDLQTPKALALLWETLSSLDLTDKEKWGVVESAEEVFGLLLTSPPEEVLPLSRKELPEEVRKLAEEREKARDSRDFAKSDELRIHIESSGYTVHDGASETTYTKRAK